MYWLNKKVLSVKLCANQSLKRIFRHLCFFLSIIRFEKLTLGCLKLILCFACFASAHAFNDFFRLYVVQTTFTVAPAVIHAIQKKGNVRRVTLYWSCSVNCQPLPYWRIELRPCPAQITSQPVLMATPVVKWRVVNMHAALYPR